MTKIYYPFLILLICYATSCKLILLKAYGFHKPVYESNSAVIDYLKKYNIDYDYVYRAKGNRDINAVANMLNSLNGITLIDSSYNILSIEDSSICHMGVRSTSKKIMSDYSLIPQFILNKNIRILFDSNLNCIDHKDSKETKKPVMLILGVSKFIGIHSKFSDIDFIMELKNAGIRDSVSIVIINSDIIEK